MDNPVGVLISSIYELFSDAIDGQGDKKVSKEATSVVRLHTDKLQQNGDLSVCNEDSWMRLFATNPSAIKLSKLAHNILGNSRNEHERIEACRSLLEASAKWIFPLEQFKISNDRGIAFLKRITVINEIIQLVINNEGTYGKVHKKTDQRVHLLPLQQNEENENKLTFHREVLLHSVLNKLLEYSSWTLVNSCQKEDNLLEVKVTSVSQQIDKSANNCSFIKCGVVMDSSTKKLTSLSKDEYNSMRSNDIYLMARHKYGIRTKYDDSFKALIARLGVAAATVDLLEVKHTSPVNIIKNGTGSTKGAAFILYNSARLETLLRTFDQHVEAKTYPALPALHEVDLSLLTEEEEWQLVYVYIFAFPQLIETCLDRLQQGLVATHLLVRFLNNFISLFSAYYRRVRIFTEARSNLIPVLFARIFLLKAVRLVLNKILNLLDISPVTFM